jgi:hypothetical protein
MPRSRHPLTAEVQRTITAYIRAGAFPHVAAAAAGLPRSVFERCLHKGRLPRGRRRYREFHDAVLQAVAQARIRAEAAVFKSKPLDWLRSGPGRETSGSPGWTASARPAPVSPRASNPFLQAEIQELVAVLLRLLAPFPEARTVVAAALAQPPPKGPQ